MNFMSIIEWMERGSVVLMLVVFVSILLTTYWPGRKRGIERDGRIPLDDEPQGDLCCADKD